MTSMFLPEKLSGPKVTLVHASESRSEEHLECVKEIWPQATRWLDYAYGSSAPPPDHILLEALAEWSVNWKRANFKKDSMWHYHLLRNIDNKLGGIITVSVENIDPARVAMHYALRPTMAGQGLTTEAIKILSTYLLSLPKVHEVILTIEEDNIASRRVADKAGFVSAPEHTQHEINGLGKKVPFHGYVRRK